MKLEVYSEELEEFETGFLEETVENKLREMIAEKVRWSIYNCDNCESPIEKMFAIALSLNEDKFTFSSHDGCFNWNTQAKIICPDKEYRVDFLINVMTDSNTNLTIAVECDGKDYHSATNDQVERDYKRDRDLYKCGIQTIRFSGSEIYNNPESCIDELYRMIFHKQRHTIRFTEGE